MIGAAVPADDVAERLLRRAADRRGRGPLAWAAAPLLGAGLVLDLCCGTGPLRDELPPGRWLGVDPSAGSRQPRLRGRPSELPLRTNAVDGISLLLSLPRLSDVDGVLAELRRVLRPGGTVVVLVPSSTMRSLPELRLMPLLAHVHRGGWPNRSALDRTGWLLAAADFALLGDDRVSFALPLPDRAAAHGLVDDLPRAGLWPPHLPTGLRAQLAEGLAAYAGPGRVLPVPLRRLVARR